MLDLQQSGSNEYPAVFPLWVFPASPLLGPGGGGVPPGGKEVIVVCGNASHTSVVAGGVVDDAEAPCCP